MRFRPRGVGASLKEKKTIDRCRGNERGGGKRSVQRPWVSARQKRKTTLWAHSLTRSVLEKVPPASLRGLVVSSPNPDGGRRVKGGGSDGKRRKGNP